MKKNKKSELKKEFLRLKDRYDDLTWGRCDREIYTELDKPIRDGYDVTWELRSDILSGPLAPQLLAILENFGESAWVKNKDCIKRYRKGYQELIEPSFKILTSRKLDSYQDWVSKWYRVDYGRKSFTDYYGVENKHYVCCIPKYYLVKKITPSFITHRLVIQPDVESERNQLYNLLISKKYYKLFNHRDFSDKSTSRLLNKSNRRKDKTLLKGNSFDYEYLEFTPKHRHSGIYNYY